MSPLLFYAYLREGRRDEFTTSPKELAQSDTQTTSARIRTLIYLNYAAYDIFGYLVEWHIYIYWFMNAKWYLYITSRPSCAIRWFSRLSPSLSICHYYKSLPICPPNYIEDLFSSDCNRWSANPGVSMCKGPLKKVAYEFFLASPVEVRMSCSS